MLAGQPQNKPRARDVGVPFAGTPGLLTAITAVEGVEAGDATLVGGNGKGTSAFPWSLKPGTAS